jgi:hypothetical protein
MGKIHKTIGEVIQKDQSLVHQYRHLVGDIEEAKILDETARGMKNLAAISWQVTRRYDVLENPSNERLHHRLRNGEEGAERCREKG